MLQQHFDTAWNVITAQGKPSVNSQGYCLYRGPDDCVCAFGAILSDDDYNREMDDEGGMTAGKVIRRYGLEHKYGDTHFYDELQDCHDDAYRDGDFIAGFQKRMRRLAENWNLNVPT